MAATDPSRRKASGCIALASRKAILPRPPTIARILRPKKGENYFGSRKYFMMWMGLTVTSPFADHLAQHRQQRIKALRHVHDFLLLAAMLAAGKPETSRAIPSGSLPGRARRS
jgi:hypothetical protein